MPKIEFKTRRPYAFLLNPIIAKTGLIFRHKYESLIILDFVV